MYLYTVTIISRRNGGDHVATRYHTTASTTTEARIRATDHHRTLAESAGQTIRSAIVAPPCHEGVVQLAAPAPITEAEIARLEAEQGGYRAG